MMKKAHMVTLLLTILVSCSNPEKSSRALVDERNDVIIVHLGIENNQVSADWINALRSREHQHYLDSLSRLTRPISEEEKGWKELIESKVGVWKLFKDSLMVPFGDINVKDTTYVLLGYRGSDDGFTYGYETVCFDLTALQNAYGLASEPVNDNRIDRLFAHEYTHLLHKEWARQKGLKLKTFKDSILWECLYEGIGMYRSMSARWFPVGDALPDASKNAFEVLYPTFADRLIAIDTTKQLTEVDKKRLHANLSRGSMKMKWGALPVGVWLALEAKGNDRNLVQWIERGPDAVISLARKHLTGESKERFDAVFKD